MKITIDSDIFWSASESESCIKALRTLQDNRANFLCVTNEELRQAYIEFARTHINRRLNKVSRDIRLNIALKIAHSLSRKTSERVLYLDTNLLTMPSSIQKILHKNSELKGEQGIITIAYAMHLFRIRADLGPSLVILLVDRKKSSANQENSSSIELPKRLESKLFEDLQTIMPDVKVAYTDEDYMTKFYIDPEHLVNQKQADQIFELQSTIWLARSYRCILGPEWVNDEQIDAWCYKVEENQVTEVYIGEAKHRTSDSKGIDSDLVNRQFPKKIEAIKRFDWAKLQLEKSPDIRYFGLLISNSVDIEESVAEGIRSLSDRFEMDILVVHVRLTEDWKTNDQFKLKDANFEIHTEYGYKKP